jgi:hypothetical protein
MIKNSRTEPRVKPAHGYSATRGGLPCAVGRISGWAMAWWCGPAAEVPHGTGAARAPDAFAAWSSRGGHAHGGRAARLVCMLQWTRCPKKGGVSTMRAAATRLMRWRRRGLTRAAARRAGVERRWHSSVPQWRRHSSHGWHWWWGPALLEGKGEGETHATCEPRCTEDRLTEEEET